MTTNWTKIMTKCKPYLMGAFLMLTLTACSTNPATGDRQFTALLPVSSEAQVGAEEHAKIEAQFGKFMTGPVADYVNRVGQKVAAHTERKDVQYRFHVIDSPMVNAFALPGGYIYVSRGLLTLANSEAELAAVIGHEIGHVTARHAAERMSHGTLVGLGAAVLGAASGSNAVAQAAGTGANLYLSSYSRSQEHQSDELGVRYLSRAGYNPLAMANFLKSLDAQSKLEAKQAGQKGTGFNYFSTHPLTAERVQQARTEATQFPQNGADNRAAYLTQINGLTFGDSPSQGFAKGNRFYHPELGFTFTVPQGTVIQNSAAQVVAQHANGSVILFDAAKNANRLDPASYIRQVWMKGEASAPVESIQINGMRAATGAFSGSVQGRAMTIRLVAIEWAPDQFFRFQMAIPKGVSDGFVNELKETTYSFRRLTAAEKSSIKPRRLIVLEARNGATLQSMAEKMAVDGDKVESFLVLNGMTPSDPVVAGQPYKIVIN